MVETSADEELDCVVACEPNGKSEVAEDVVNGNKDQNPPGQLGAPLSRTSDMEHDEDGEKSENPEIQKPAENERPPSSTEVTSNAILEQQRTDFTVAQRVAHATERRVSGNRTFVASPTSSGEKSAEKSYSLSPRRPLNPENTSHHPDDDSGSMTSSTGTSTRTNKFKTTVPVAPTFRSGQRAERRKEFFSKFNEKQKALEEEKLQAEARKMEEQEAALKELRKNLVIRAKPMPSFYQEGPPPKPELRKVPPTRAKSPKFTRRKSCSDSPSSPLAENSPCFRTHRHSIGSARDGSTAQCSSKSGASSKSKGVVKVAKEESKSSSDKYIDHKSQPNVSVQS